MPGDSSVSERVTITPATRHQLAVMIWLAVVPTLTLLNETLGAHLQGQSVAARTFIVASVAVPIVIYGVMPLLHRLRARIIASRAR
jgi:antibiotic biosynthesis monooxygenase (ABM) superfamily enzyme